MRVRTLLTLTAIVAMMIVAVVVYLILTVPNDVQAAALMRAARRQIAAGAGAQARQSLERRVQQYPRTDAAAAATVALESLGENEREQMVAQIAALRQKTGVQQKQLSALAARVAVLEARPVPQPAPPPPPPKTIIRRDHRRRRR